MDTLPLEVILHILSYCTPNDIAHVSQASQKLLQICRTDSLWQAHCHDRFRVRRFTPSTELPTFYQLYTRLLRHYGYLLGFWMSLESWRGAFIQVSWNEHLNRLDGERLWPKNRLTNSYHNYSLLPGVFVNDIDCAIERELIFHVSIPPDASNPVVTCLEAEPRRIINFLEQANLSMFIAASAASVGQITQDKLTQYDAKNLETWFLGNALNELSVWRSSLDFPSQLPMPDTPLCFNLLNHGTRTKYLQLPLHILNPPPTTSQDPTMIAPHYGLYAGSYGPHGVEFLLVKEHYTENPLASRRTKVMAHKVTGDRNVPRGQLSWMSNLHDPIRIAEEQEFRGSNVYEGMGQVAFDGFINNSLIPGALILCSPTKLAFAWEDLAHITIYRRFSRTAIASLFARSRICNFGMLRFTRASAILRNGTRRSTPQAILTAHVTITTSARRLPSIEKRPPYLLYGVIGVSLWAGVIAGTTNYQRLNSSVVDGTLFTVRYNDHVQELLGAHVDYADKWPWISGTVNNLKGKVDIRFWVKGDRGVRGRVHFAANRVGSQWKTQEFTLTTEGPDTQCINIITPLLSDVGAPIIQTNDGIVVDGM
ncbi:hypothetical protein BZG36_04630 [Bifiguratus adelaidae]|uniref:F-box domain-containing protein n=1 Tax=Bifiguratus adelaidae TaxID=1938954 RepID=A0A261XUU9_9FUNG|nr:hypothetical protein BZG36_04630 [Bifiguratus adelaidae]